MNTNENKSKTLIDIGIVMVNYNNFEDTIECVESFLNKLDTEKFQIVIFDNNSPNKSGLILKEKYIDNPHVEVVLSDANVGNGFGWNGGLKHLHNDFLPKFTILSDNDVWLLDNYFFKHLSDEYQKSEFAGLAPMIMTPDGRCDDNPIFDKFYTRQLAKRDIKELSSTLRAVKFHYVKLQKLFKRIKYKFCRSYREKRMSLRRKDKSPGIFLERRENVVLHGCFFIFSPKYFDFFDGLDVRTFMYAEEDITYAHILEKGLKTVYLPDIQIYHKGGSSVKSTFKNSKKQRMFLIENHIKATKAYLELLDELKM